jgi:GT2 family glycosyltransferase
MRPLPRITAEYYILLNTDVEVTEDFIQPVITLMESDKKIGACQPKILSVKERHKFEYAGAAGGWIDLIGFQFARGRIFDTLEDDKGQYNNNDPIFWACGACIFLRSSLFQQLGGFYEYYFMQSEETDLCWRLQNEGYKVYCCGSSAIYHVGGVHLSNSDPFKAYLNMRNNMIMLTRNLHTVTLITLIPSRLIINLTLAVGFLLKGEYAHTKAILKAQADYLYWLFFIKKKQLPKKKGRKNIDGIYKGIILWDYLIRRKRIFSEVIVESGND